MRLTNLDRLKPAEEVAVIINVSTKVMTTLALQSVLRHAGVPVLLIDCESTDGSLEHFLSLMDSYSFDLLSAPLREHGETLDWLFARIPAKKVLLVDSDLEICDPQILARFREFIEDEGTFGCGFLHEAYWLDAPKFAGRFNEGAYCRERPWIPLVLFKAHPVREALEAGHTFRSFYIYNDFFPSRLVSMAIAHLRHFVPLLRKWKFRFPRCFRQAHNGHRPCLVWSDTGADIYEYLRHQRYLSFVGIPERFHARYVTHFYGATRNVVNPNNADRGKRHLRNAETARQRLRDVYGIVMAE
jgi:hypothetical protein